MSVIPLEWQDQTDITSKAYKCWYCGLSLASNKGWFAKELGDIEGTVSFRYASICICHRCTRPTFIDVDGKQVPGVPFGNPVNDISEESVHALYEEARRATKEGSYTAAVLCCRKLLMHIAVSKGAKENENFAYYIDYLAKKHYISPEAIAWVDYIRTKGNEANHDIVIMEQKDAEKLIVFSEMLLKTIYEFPAAIKREEPSQQ